MVLRLISTERHREIGRHNYQNYLGSQFLEGQELSWSTVWMPSHKISNLTIQEGWKEFELFEWQKKTIMGMLLMPVVDRICSFCLVCVATTELRREGGRARERDRQSETSPYLLSPNSFPVTLSVFCIFLLGNVASENLATSRRRTI